jgi:hypothetical protein
MTKIGHIYPAELPGRASEPATTAPKSDGGASDGNVGPSDVNVGLDSPHEYYSYLHIVTRCYKYHNYS